MNTSRKAIRKMGFVRDQQGIMKRYLNEPGHWKDHLEKTRSFINDSFSNADIETVAVLGSGWLLDVPIESMVHRFRRIFLVDITHPQQIIKKVKTFDNVELAETDLTGGAVEQLWQLLQRGDGSKWDSMADNLELTRPLEEIRPDAVISVNLLNQLDIMVCDYLIERFGAGRSELKFLREKIQSFHLEWITSLPGCLVTDSVEVRTDRQGNETSFSLLHTAPPDGFRKEAWRWEFDTRGTYRTGFRTDMEVLAVEWD